MTLEQLLQFYGPLVGLLVLHQWPANLLVVVAVFGWATWHNLHLKALT